MLLILINLLKQVQVHNKIELKTQHLYALRTSLLACKASQSACYHRVAQVPPHTNLHQCILTTKAQLHTTDQF